MFLYIRPRTFREIVTACPERDWFLSEPNRVFFKFEIEANMQFLARAKMTCFDTKERLIVPTQ